jgi:hypothetical protein
MSHIILNFQIPERHQRGRRYAAYQLEYYKELRGSFENVQFLQESFLVWEYARPNLPFWNGTLVPPFMHVRRSCCSYAVLEMFPSRSVHAR